jgi:hypothetical protein
MEKLKGRKLFQTALEKNQCFQRAEKIYKISEIDENLLTIIKFIDIDLIEKDLEKEDFLKEFSDAILLEESYFNQLAITHNENKIRENVENYEFIQQIRKKFQQFFSDSIV